MRQTLLLCWLTTLLSFSAAAVGLAQDESDPEPKPPEPSAQAPADSDGQAPAKPAPAASGDAAKGDTEEDASAEPPRRLSPPQLPALELDEERSAKKKKAPAGRKPPAEGGEGKDAAPETAAPAAQGGWTAPEPVFQLHGYLRTRGSLKKRMWLGRTEEGDWDRRPQSGRASHDPFLPFKPGVNTSDIAGGCGESSGADGPCDRKRTVSANLRLRLKPELHLSDDVRVKAWIDVLDNYAFGSGGADSLDLGSSVKARRVWGEVRNRDLGELRFGRMGADWGLGILDNGGDRYGLDSDFSSEVDRVMAVTNLAGFYLMAAWDWAAEGQITPAQRSPSGVPIDAQQEDDVDQVTLVVARRMAQDAEASALARGEPVFNFGLFFRYRDQLLQYDPGAAETAGEDGGDGAGGDTPGSGAARDGSTSAAYRRVNRTDYIPDVWFQFLYEGLRLELEAMYLWGAQEGACPRLVADSASSAKYQNYDEQGPSSAGGECKFRQYAAALELEYRLLDDRLGLQLYGGLASGDPDAYGLAATNDSTLQRTSSDTVGDRRVSTASFHPDYRVDLILWRTIMQRVSGAYYVRPGIAYDFIRDPYGELLGGRVEVIYSRAMSAEQTWGKSANLGLEIDASLYYRSEDGPDPLDGFYGLVQWGVLFPFSGLGYAPGQSPAPGVKNALIFRGMLGVAF